MSQGVRHIPLQSSALQAFWLVTRPGRHFLIGRRARGSHPSEPLGWRVAHQSRAEPHGRGGRGVAGVGTPPGEHLHPPTPNSPDPVLQLAETQSGVAVGRGWTEEVPTRCSELGRERRETRVSICQKEPLRQTQTQILLVFMHPFNTFIASTV